MMSVSIILSLGMVTFPQVENTSCAQLSARMMGIAEVGELRKDIDWVRVDPAVVGKLAAWSGKAGRICTELDEFEYIEIVFPIDGQEKQFVQVHKSMLCNHFSKITDEAEVTKLNAALEDIQEDDEQQLQHIIFEVSEDDGNEPSDDVPDYVNKELLDHGEELRRKLNLAKLDIAFTGQAPPKAEEELSGHSAQKRKIAEAELLDSDDETVPVGEAFRSAVAHDVEAGYELDGEAASEFFGGDRGAAAKKRISAERKQKLGELKGGLGMTGGEDASQTHRRVAFESDDADEAELLDGEAASKEPKRTTLGNLQLAGGAASKKQKK
jgi:hypothetical protein